MAENVSAATDGAARKVRCHWVNPNNEVYVAYHDKEWGVPCHDDRALFELLVLECFQVGLSWETILNKREAFRAAFDDFDPLAVSGFDQTKVKDLMDDAGIVRNRHKINAAIRNASAFLRVQEEFGSFDSYIWGFVHGESIADDGSLGLADDLGKQVSRDLKKRGFTYVGPVVARSFLQACGIVNGHEPQCFRCACE